MKKIFFLSAMAMLLCLSACNDDEEAISPAPTATGTVEDSEGNEYGWVRIGNLDWTTSNAQNGTYMGDLEYYDDIWGYDYIFSSSTMEDIDNRYLPAYGNLLSYEEALESAPEGWRLPTDEDWKNLERALGMEHVDDTGWRGTEQGRILQQKDGGPMLGLTLGGGIMKISLSNTAAYLQIAYEKERGYYWTATADNSREDIEKAYIRKVMFNRGQVERISVDTKDRYCSVRWVRDAVQTQP